MLSFEKNILLSSNLYFFNDNKDIMINLNIEKYYSGALSNSASKLYPYSNKEGLVT